jgi:hypothetical protein
VRLVPGYTPSPLLLLLLFSLGGGLGQEGKEKQDNREQQEQHNRQQQQQQEDATSPSSFATTWWEVTLQVLAAAVRAGLQAAEDMSAAGAEPDPSVAASASAESAAAAGVDRRHLVPSPVALPLWAPLARLAQEFTGFTLNTQHQGDARVHHLATAMLQATVEARYHPTEIEHYAVPSRSPTTDPWALYGAVSDLGVRLGRLEQQVGVYMALGRSFTAAMEALPAASEVRQKVGSYCGTIPTTLAVLERSMGAARVNHTALMASWATLPAVGAHAVLQWQNSKMVLAQHDDHSPVVLVAEHEEQRGSANTGPHQQQQEAVGTSAVAAQSTGASTSRRAGRRAQQRQSSAGLEAAPIRWLPPGAKAFFSWGRNSPPPQAPTSAGGLADPPVHGAVVSTDQEWRLCVAASEVLDAMDAAPRWFTEWQAIWLSLKQAWSLRRNQLAAATATTQQPQPQQQQPSGPSRRPQEPPLDPAQVLAAARLCFGGLQEVAEEMLCGSEDPGGM